MQTRAARRALAAAQPIPVDGDDGPVNLVTNTSLADHENIWHEILSHLAAPNISNEGYINIKAPCTRLLRLSGGGVPRLARWFHPDGVAPAVYEQVAVDQPRRSARL